jgi:hypothetical protein
MKEKNYSLLKKKKNNIIIIIMEYDSEIASKFYQNNRYRDQFETKSLLLDVTITSTSTSFMVNLPEELNINSLSDVYLDTLVTQQVALNTASNAMGFLVGIEQIEMKTVGGNSTDTSGGGDNKYNGKFFIPNEASDVSTTIHKGRKLNYVGKIRPGKYHKVPITITDLNNGSIYKSSSDGRFIAEFIIVEK